MNGMSWQTVVVIGLLVAGAVVAGIFGQQQLAGVLGGAAAGMAVPALSGRTDTVIKALPLVGALTGAGIATLVGMG